eukprot:838069-Prymnesium_polylepis.2
MRVRERMVPMLGRGQTHRHTRRARTIMTQFARRFYRHSARRRAVSRVCSTTHLPVSLGPKLITI